MKKRLFVFISIFIALQAKAQKIVDPNFAKAIREFCTTCLDNDNRITEDGQKLRNLVVSIQQITDLTGVVGFGALQSLNCTNNNLTFIPPLPSNLKTLLISHNKITQLTNIPENLTALYCIGNQLKSIPQLPARLEFFDCSYNALSILPKMPSTLKTLFCSNNQLTTLPELPKNLEGLECNNNKLKNLPPTLPKTLSIISCQNNSDLVCLPRLPDSLLYLFIPKGVNCLPNSVKKAVVECVEGIVSQPVTLTICTNIQLALCPPILPKPVETGKKITIFPNPTEGFLIIKNQGYDVQKVVIFNYVGQIVKQVNTNDVDLTALATGWYLIQVQTSEGIISEKIVKQ
jgi:hypothetical protein